MNSRLYLKILFFLLAGLLTGMPGVVKAQSPDKPNVLFLSIDDLLATLGAYGDPIAITPNIDKLAGNSVVFNRHYVQQAVCGPSRTSMLTGLRPDEVGVVNQITHFREKKPDVVTLPQLFKNNGYHTVGIGKVFHFRHGFQDAVSWTTEVYASNRGIKRNDYALPENQHGGKAAATERADVPYTAYPDGRYADLAMDFLHKFKLSEEPFFLTVGFQKPHLPFAAPSGYWDIYDREQFYPVLQPERPIGAPEIAFHEDNELRGYTDIPREGPIPVEKIKELRHGYYAAVSYIDALIGQILETLDDLGLRENTIIVFWSDHGFHLGELGLWAKSTTYEMSAHAPLMISVPGLTNTGTKTNALVESLDIYPTLADLANITPESPLSGESLRPLIDNPDAEWREFAFNQFPRPLSAIGRAPMTHMGYSVRTPDWRFTAWFNVETEKFEYPELYSMDPNPARVVQESNVESVNLSGKSGYEEIEARLFEMIRNYQIGAYDHIVNR